MKDLYNILGVSKTATTYDIKKAYRKLVLVYHPDRNNGSKLYEKIFIEINEAYAILSDTSRRQAYDDAISREAKHPGKRDVFDTYHDAYKKRYEQRKDAVPEKAAVNPFLMVFFLFFGMLLISFLITPKENEYQGDDSFTYTIRDSNGLVIFESSDHEEVRNYLQKKYKNDTRFYKMIDSITQP